MVLKPQDLLILLKIIARAGDAWSYGSLAVELAMSPAEVHSGVKRAIRARLAMPGESGAPARPVLRALEEFVIHGAPYVFIAEHGEISRGVATAWAAPMFGNDFVETSELPLVWPHPDGKSRGQSLTPLYRAAPYAALQDERLYELLALVDMLRIGRARERNLARERLKYRLTEYRENAGSANHGEHEH